MGVQSAKSATPPSSPEINFPHTHQLRENIVKWLNENLLNTPEFHEFQRKLLEYVLINPGDDGLDDFPLATEIAKEHAVAVSFLGMCRAQKTLSQCEFYFRRFPFHGIPISRDEHLQNICEFYLSSFYIMRCRIKITLNNVKVACPNSKWNIKAYLRAFDREFDQELRARNRVHHHETFQDIGLERISITEMISEGPDLASKFWRGRHVLAYRQFSKEWSLRARRRAVTMQAYVEAVALGLLTEAGFLGADSRH